jgi:putative SOS response-associated peptidase YedK
MCRSTRCVGGLFRIWCNNPTGGRKPINAKCETVGDLPTFRDAYRRRRCIVPVDGFFEWKAIKGQKAKQPYAIAMKDGAPFGIAGIWENWKEPASSEWIRTFAIITTDANELVSDIHDRMPVILSRYDYARWLGEEPDPRDLMRPFSAGLMRMWPISTRVNKPENEPFSSTICRRSGLMAHGFIGFENGALRPQTKANHQTNNVYRRDWRSARPPRSTGGKARSTPVFKGRSKVRQTQKLGPSRW